MINDSHFKMSWKTFFILALPLNLFLEVSAILAEEAIILGTCDSGRNCGVLGNGLRYACDEPYGSVSYL
jgi:hypothetical protein